jgi:Ferrochelatase
MEYRELAESNGIEQWRRVPALNTDERFINDMADIVVRTCSLCTCVRTDGCVRACVHTDDNISYISCFNLI